MYMNREEFEEAICSEYYCTDVTAQQIASKAERLIEKHELEYDKELRWDVILDKMKNYNDVNCVTSWNWYAGSVGSFILGEEGLKIDR